MAFGQDYHEVKKKRLKLYLKMVNDFIAKLELEPPRETLNDVELQAFQIVNEYYLGQIDELSGLTLITQVLNDYFLSKSNNKIKHILANEKNKQGKTNRFRKIGQDGKQ